MLCSYERVVMYVCVTLSGLFSECLFKCFTIPMQFAKTFRRIVNVVRVLSDYMQNPVRTLLCIQFSSCFENVSPPLRIEFDHEVDMCFFAAFAEWFWQAFVFVW